MNNKIKLPIWVCEECGSSKIQQKAWVQLNTSNPEIDFIESDDGDYWCDECQEHTNVIMKE